MAQEVFARFPLEVQQRLLSVAVRVDLPVRTELYRTGCDARYVYFLTGGMASVVVQMLDGGSIEVGMIGDEGMVGTSALLGSPVMTNHCFMQIAGSGLRVRLETMQGYFDQNSQVRSVLLAFLRGQLIIAEQVTACNRTHVAEARLARWLLTAADRVHSMQVDLTQEFLGEMLGMTRTTVALVAGNIQRSGSISYSRGRVLIRDRTVLMKMACECYAVVRAATVPLERNYALHCA